MARIETTLAYPIGFRRSPRGMMPEPDSRSLPQRPSPLLEESFLDPQIERRGIGGVIW